MKNEFVLIADSIFDGLELIDCNAVLIRDKKIAALGRSGEFPESKYPLVKVSGTLMPGMINMHVHLVMSGGANPTEDIIADDIPTSAARAAENMRALLYSGATTVRDLGGKANVCFSLAKAVNNGLLQGPRIITSGRAICITGGHGYFFSDEIDGPIEARKAARKLIKEGAETLKIIATGGVMTPGMKAGAPQMELEEIEAVCRVGKKAGKITASHAQGKEGILASLKGGCKTIEHGFEITEEAIALFLENDAYLTPTFMAQRGILSGEGRGTPDWMIEKLKPVVETHAKSFDRAIKAGVKTLAGTDAGTPFNPFADTYKEILALAEMGLSNREALRAATSNASACLDRSDIGIIKEGAFADIIGVCGNPLEDLSTLKEPLLVAFEGKIIRDETDGPRGRGFQ